MRRLVIHWPGRTGSSSVHAAVVETGVPFLQLLHTHDVARQTLEYLAYENDNYDILRSPPFAAGIHFQNPPRGLEDTLTVVPVRSRYLRNTSDFLLAWLGGPGRQSSVETKDLEHLVREFRTSYPHTYVDEWVTRELLTPFGIALEGSEQIEAGCARLVGPIGTVIIAAVPLGFPRLHALMGEWLGCELAPFPHEMPSDRRAIELLRSAISEREYDKMVGDSSSQLKPRWSDLLAIVDAYG